MLLVKRLGPSSGDKRYINAIAIAIAIAILYSNNHLFIEFQKIYQISIYKVKKQT